MGYIKFIHFHTEFILNNTNFVENPKSTTLITNIVCTNAIGKCTLHFITEFTIVPLTQIHAIQNYVAIQFLIHSIQTSEVGRRVFPNIHHSM